MKSNQHHLQWILAAAFMVWLGYYIVVGIVSIGNPFNDIYKRVVATVSGGK